MNITINLQDGVPIYRQIVNQIKYKIASGSLSAGDELPTIRSLAERLLVTPNTVVKAYSVLEAEGVIVKRHGSGTFVSDNLSPLAKRERNRILKERIDTLLAEAELLQFDLPAVLDLLHQRYNALKKEGESEASKQTNVSKSRSNRSPE